MSEAAVHGLVDRDGRLIEAGGPLDELNTRAGGAIGQPFAVPQIAVLARLAQRLGITVSRHVFAADGPDEVELWVVAHAGRRRRQAGDQRLAREGAVDAAGRPRAARPRPGAAGRRLVVGNRRDVASDRDRRRGGAVRDRAERACSASRSTR